MESTNAKRGNDLVVDLANMVNNPALGDVILISGDGDCLWACRLLLAARSPVFKSMLMNGVTVEATNSEIPLPSIRTSALLPVLEYVYTGTLSKHSISVQNSVNVIYASRYFLLSNLEELAISFLSAQSCASLVDGLGHDLPKHLSEAVEMLSPDLDHKILTLLVNAYKCISASVENVKGFSQKAMRVFLDMTQTNGRRPSASEYKRLRCLLIWCAVFVSDAAGVALSLYLPTEQPAVTSTSYASNASKLCACKPYQRSLAEIFRPWISKINFYRVHPKVLAAFVEPLGIVEPTYFLQIYRFHAMFGKELSFLLWARGAPSLNLRILEEGSVIECASKLGIFAFATTAAPITRMSEVFEWDFVIERVCPFMGLGFYSGKAPPLGVQQELVEKDGWIICSSSGNYHDYTSSTKKVVYTSKFGEGTRINVRVCMEKHTCEFKIDNTTCGAAWDNIPSQVYPAVIMRFPGRVRIEPAQHDEIKAFMMETMT